MKKITIAMAALLSVAATSCKKSNDVTPPVSAGAQVTKIEFPATGNAQIFTYNSSGRLVMVKNNSFTNNYTVSPFSLEVLNSSNVKEYGLSNIVFSNNRISSYNYNRYKADGTIQWSDANSFEYDANGYQTKKSYGAYVYTSVITGGNTTSQTITNTTNGSTRTKVIEYYMDKPNKLNVNFFEDWCLDQIISDAEAVGKKNANLPKKMTETTTNNTEVTEFVYTTDAKGLITQVTITITTTPNAGGTPSVDTYVAKFSYQ